MLFTSVLKFVTDVIVEYNETMKQILLIILSISFSFLIFTEDIAVITAGGGGRS